MGTSANPTTSRTAHIETRIPTSLRGGPKLKENFQKTFALSPDRMEARGKLFVLLATRMLGEVLPRTEKLCASKLLHTNQIHRSLENWTVRMVLMLVSTTFRRFAFRQQVATLMTSWSASAPKKNETTVRPSIILQK